MPVCAGDAFVPDGEMLLALGRDLGGRACEQLPIAGALRLARGNVRGAQGNCRVWMAPARAV
ncbi:hypothetical protein SBBP2_1400007 [Burkholderiales bacterium]|jgi:hypothetical protein|nr:hypothetical protein SBBP2_1400007 [Burkholderiales bacterium]